MNFAGPLQKKYLGNAYTDGAGAPRPSPSFVTSSFPLFASVEVLRIRNSTGNKGNEEVTGNVPSEGP
jgi:hypothetical protein